MGEKTSTHIVVIGNEKGGSGKTTAAVHLAVALARLGRETGKQAKGGLTRFLPAHCSFGTDGVLPKVELVPWHGSGDIAAMARANCFLVLDDEHAHPEPGETLRILLI